MIEVLSYKVVYRDGFKNHSFRFKSKKATLNVDIPDRDADKYFRREGNKMFINKQEVTKVMERYGLL